MKRITLILLSLFMFTTTLVHAYDLEQYQLDILDNHSDYFEYIDDITINVSQADGVILEPMTDKLLLDVRHNLIDRKSENDKRAERLKDTLPSVVEQTKELNDKLDSIYEDLEESIYDFYSIVGYIQNGEVEYDLEALANRAIKIKYNYSKMVGKSPIESDEIYQRIRIDYE